MTTGIDYGRGITNIDRETGIRYGVINVNEVLQAWADESEGYYGEATCPKCGGPVTDMDDRCTSDFYCADCDESMYDDAVYSDEPLGYSYDREGYKAQQSGDGCDVFIAKSPYFTYAQFCSPCAPGAVHLLSEMGKGDGPKGYCFGHDWFESGIAPYTVYNVETGEIVLPS